MKPFRKVALRTDLEAFLNQDLELDINPTTFVKGTAESPPIAMNLCFSSQDGTEYLQHKGLTVFFVMFHCLLCQKSQAMLFKDLRSCRTEDFFFLFFPWWNLSGPELPEQSVR